MKLTDEVFEPHRLWGSHTPLRMRRMPAREAPGKKLNIYTGHPKFNGWAGPQFTKGKQQGKLKFQDGGELTPLGIGKHLLAPLPLLCAYSKMKIARFGRAGWV